MASPQSSADAVRLAVGSTSTCTSATAVLLSDLLSPKVDEGATSTTISRKGPQSSKTSSQRQTKAQSGRARSKTGALGLGEDNCRDYLSPKERSILATEVINATLKSLSDAIKAQSSTPIHRPVPGKDLVKSTTRRGLRRSNSLPPSPLQARSLNRVLSSPNIATRENRSSSSASSISSTCRPTAECARIAFACLRVLSAPTSQEVTLPTLQLENGMSTLVGKLISLGLDDLAVKELRVLKRRLETPDVPKKGPIPRPNTTIISQTLPELLDFGGISATGEKASLVTTTQVQVLRLMTSARKPKLVEEALKVLDLKHASSPTRLLLVEAELCKDKKQSDKIARKIQALSEILLSLCPPVSATDDALAQEARVSISPEVAVRIQCLALHNRFLWWGLAGHQGDLSKDIFEPFLRCLQAFARRSQGSTEETYLLASSVSKDLQTLLSDCSDTQPRALKSTLAGIYRLLGSLSRDANHIQDAIKWTEHGQRVLDLSFDSDAKRCSILARLISLKFRKAPLDSKDEELLLTLLEGLERPFKGEMPEIDDLMLEVSNARRFVIAMLSQNMASPDTNLQDQLSAGMREMCEQLIFLCPRLCLRYLGNNPDHKAGTKDIVRYEQRRQFIAKRGLCSIDSALFLVRSILGQDRVAWELVDSKLQDCLLLLDRLDINSREMPGEGEQSSKAYYTRISNLYYTQFLNMKRVVESKDGQQIRALRRSIDSIRGRPQQERKGGQFSTKLERMAEICRTTGRYDELYTTLIALRDELIEEGVLSDVAENASYQPIPAAWALNEKTSGLARTIQSILKVQLRYLKMPHPMSLVPDSWAVEERGIVLEHQIDVLLNQAKSNSVLETELSIVKELLSIYTKKDYPLRRLRVLLRISTEALDNQESVMQELELLRVEDLNLGESQDQGLQKFLCHYRALTMTTLALRKAQPDPEELKESISTWLSIRAQSKDSATFQDHIGDIRQLLVHLDSIASWLQMKGLDSTRVSALRLIADINELCGDCSTPDDLVLSFSRLGDQWLQLGYSRKAGLALDKATSYNHRKGVSSYVSLELHLSYCRYLIAIGSLDEVDDHMACAQTFYVQQKDFLAKSCSTSVLQQRTMMNLLVSNAYAISSSLAHRRGAGHIALSHAKQSLRLLRRAWVNTSNESQARPQAGLQVDMDKLTEDISEMSLSNSRISLVENGLEHASRPSLWGLVTPLFRSLTHLSSLFEHHGMFQETSYYAEQAYRFAKETQSDSLLAVASTLLGSVWLKAGSLDKGSDLLMHAEKLLSKSHPSRQSVVLSYNMGLMYSLLGDHIGEVEAYNNAVATIEMLVNSNHIQSIEGINNDPSSLEAQMSSLSLEKQKVVRTRKPATRTKKITTRKAAVRAKTPVEAIAPVADECPPLMYLKAEILRQKATALMITKKLSDSLQLLDEVDTHYSTHIDPVGHKVLKARHLLLQCFDQMNADPVYSVLQDSTISFPSAVGPLREKHGDKLAAGKQSPSRRLQAGRNNRERIASKTPSPDTFFEKLRQAQDLLIEAHAVALALSPVAVIHNVASLLHSVAILLSAVSPTKGKALAYPGTGLCSIETVRTVALRRERKAILNEPRAVLKLDEASWPHLASCDPKRSSIGSTSDASRLQKDYIDIIPKSWTVVSIALSEDHDELSVTKMQAGQSPFVLRLPLGRHNSMDADEEVFDFDQGRAELHEILGLANESAHDARNRKGKEAKVAWWEEREALDARLRDLLENIEKVWLGGFTGIFSQHTRRDDLLASFQKSFQNILDKHLPSRRKVGRKNMSPKTTLDSRILDLFIGLGDASEEDCDLAEPLTDLLYFVVDVLQFHGELNAYAEIDFDSIVVDMHDALRSYHAAVRNSAYTNEGKHMILILDKALHSFPWESLPCMDGLAVSRLPSLGCLRERILAQEKDERNTSPDGHYINKENGSYILNPGGDLKDTQEVFQKTMKELSTWQGIVGREPSEEEFKQTLESKDLLLYFGHGSGAQYIRAREIKRLETCAVTMLMGCSSGALVETGEFEPYGSPINYMHAGCPALVATLWDVTDKDIDRFANSTLRHWGLLEAETGGKGRAGKKPVASENQVSLVEAVAKGKSACHLRYLNAGSVVVYGIPVYFQ